MTYSVSGVPATPASEISQRTRAQLGVALNESNCGKADQKAWDQGERRIPFHSITKINQQAEPDDGSDDQLDVE